MFCSERKSICTSTIQRECEGIGLNSCAASRNPLISVANREKRPQFSREHNDWTLEQWKVMWPDEFTFTLFQTDGCIRVGREAAKAKSANPTAQI